MKTAEEIWNEFDMMVKFYHSDPESVISRKDKFINLVESYVKEHARPIIELLRQARCPNGNCDNAGTLTVPTVGKDGLPELSPEECQWCWERDKIKPE